jgi:phosphopantothenoylcysteine decarboxylase/phosphopantothenate--cysteine ligase
VTLVAGPVALETPERVERVDIETAEEMATAVMAALPADAAILVAAVADWRVEPSSSKLKKGAGPPTLELVPTRDILAELAAHPQRPELLVGFAAETESVAQNAIAKRAAKGADWIVANDVSGPKDRNVMGGTRNRVQLVTAQGVEDWPEAAKEEVAQRLVERIAAALLQQQN